MKQLLIRLAVNWIPDIIDYLAKRADRKGKSGKYGNAAKELKDVITKVESAAKDGVIDEKELKAIAGEGTDLIIAVYSLFGKAEIKLKKK